MLHTPIKAAETQWHLTPQAKAIIARLQPAEFAEHKRPMPFGPYQDILVPITDRACRHTERLEAMRREAIDTAAGMTWAEADRSDAARKAYLAAFNAAPEVSDVLADAFGERGAVRSAAA